MNCRICRHAILSQYRRVGTAWPLREGPNRTSSSVTTYRVHSTCCMGTAYLPLTPAEGRELM